MAPQLKDAIIGCLLGTAVGDALGLPMEGLSKRRQQKMYPKIDGYHFLFGKGMISDDTEHTCMVAQAVITSGGEESQFSKNLEWRMRKWFVALPAGIGFATLRDILKLCVGFSAEKSGVFSAGNGPAMRSAILGVCFGDDKDKLKKLVRISTRITHTVPAVLHLWFCHPRDIHSALMDGIRCGGDTDTIGAIIRGIIGAGVGEEGIPHEMIDHLWDWPITPRWIRSLGEVVYETRSEGKTKKAPNILLVSSLVRNLFFMTVVLMHGFRRLLPPY